jgi:pyruvate-formate lyase
MTATVNPVRRRVLDVVSEYSEGKSGLMDLLAAFLELEQYPQIVYREILTQDRYEAAIDSPNSFPWLMSRAGRLLHILHPLRVDN